MKTFPSVSFVFLLLLPLSVTAQDVALPTQSSDARTLTVAVVSPRSVFGDVEANLAHFTNLIEQAQENHQKIYEHADELFKLVSKQSAILDSIHFKCFGGKVQIEVLPKDDSGGEQ